MRHGLRQLARGVYSQWGDILNRLREYHAVNPKDGDPRNKLLCFS
jgi:hypothetical protein